MKRAQTLFLTSIRRAAALALLFACQAFFPAQNSKPETQNSPTCDPSAKPFRGYSFLYPDIVNRRAAYAPYFLEFGNLYAPFFRRDIQRDENLEEWNGRFCQNATPDEVAEVVYQSSTSTLARLLEAAADRTQKTPLPGSLAGNPFAETLTYNGCAEAIEYLIFAKKCEPHVVAQDGWDTVERDAEAMQVLVNEGKARFKECRSHFFRLRYAYQIVRLAHYAGAWQQTADLYNELMPQVDRRRPSIVFYWTLGHLAGALQKLGKRPEAAYRYSLIFQNCPSKRTSAWRSFFLKNDAEWAAALRLCQSDAEKATLFAMRAGGAAANAVPDMEAIYGLNPTHPALDLLLVGTVQHLERTLLRTPATDKKHGIQDGQTRHERAAQHLAVLQKFVHRVLQERQIGDPKLWACVEAYLFLLDGKLAEAEYHLNRAEKKLDPKDTESNDPALAKQIEIWRTLIQVLSINPADPALGAEAVRGLTVFREFPGFEDFLSDYLSEGYAASGRPGKAFLANNDLAALALNPSLQMLDDLLAAAEARDKSGIEADMAEDSTDLRFTSKILEIKAMHLFSTGHPEAALATLREIPATDMARMRKFAPFKLFIKDCLGCRVPDPAPLNRLQILERLAQLEFDAKAAAATGHPDVAAEHFYLIGLALWNMSWFGYEWEAFDTHRDPDNWARLARGPVFPMSGAPDGNRENLDLDRALAMLDEALRLSRDPELSAKIAWVAAKCRQAQWLASPACKYRPGSRQIPVLPPEYSTYHAELRQKYASTAFYAQVVKECKWFAAYARR